MATLWVAVFSFIAGMYINGVVSAQPVKLQNSRNETSVTKSIAEAVFGHIKADLNTRIMNQKKNSPWKAVESVIVLGDSVLGKVFMGKRIPFDYARKGDYRVQVDYFDIIDESGSGLAVQVSLFHKISGNKVEEFSKTYFFKDIPNDGSVSFFTLNKDIDQAKASK